MEAEKVDRNGYMYSVIGTTVYAVREVGRKLCGDKRGIEKEDSR